MKKIWTFVLTGGPCSGKTTALSIIEQQLSKRGYYVLVVPESATELINSGLRPFGGSLNVIDFQKAVFEYQLEKEKLFLKYAQKLPYKKIVIVYDRGCMDGKAYLTKQQFANLLSYFQMNELYARGHYDAIFHLVTAADGAEKFYTLANNKARMESAEEAINADDLTLRSWVGHPHFCIIDNSTNFESKMNRLMAEIYSVLGDPVPIKHQKKYLIKNPSSSLLTYNLPIEKVDITQSYLHSSKKSERKIRQVGKNGNFFYYYSEKTYISGSGFLKCERRITDREYLSYISEIDPLICTIKKQRLFFVYQNQYFTIDTFSLSPNTSATNSFTFWPDQAILEIDLTSENSIIEIPEFIEVIKDVTDCPDYRNYYIAKHQGFWANSKAPNNA